MEGGVRELRRPGRHGRDRVNGVFGERMCDVAARCGAEVVRVEAEWGTAHRARAARGRARGHRRSSPSCTPRRRPASATTSSHSDRSRATRSCWSTASRPRRHPVEIDGWGIDIAYSGTQKCLGVPPGLAPLTVNARAREQFVERSQSWYLDLRMIADYAVSGSGRKYHHTAPTAMVVALHAASARCSTKGSKPVGRDMRSAGGSCTRGSRSRASRCSPRGSSPARAHHRVGARPRHRRSRRAAHAARPLRHRDRWGAGRVRREGVAHRVHGAHGAAPQTWPCCSAHWVRCSAVDDARRRLEATARRHDQRRAIHGAARHRVVRRARHAFDRRPRVVLGRGRRVPRSSRSPRRGLRARRVRRHRVGSMVQRFAGQPRERVVDRGPHRARCRRGGVGRRRRPHRHVDLRRATAPHRRARLPPAEPRHR